MNQQSQQPGQGRQPMIYRAPLCRETGCGRHTWSLYCPDHRDSKLAELEAADATSLSLSDKKLLTEFSRRENAETRRIGQRVQQALPEMFETPPTADEIETAADRYTYMAQYTEMMRRRLVIEVMEGRKASVDEAIDTSVPVGYVPGVDAATATEDASRVDPVGPAPMAAARVSSYLFDEARTARLARGETEDSAGIPLSLSPEEYGVERMDNTSETDDDDGGYMADQIMGQARIAAQEFRARQQHEQQVRMAQQQAQQQFGAERMSGYDNTPTQIQGAQSNAWAGVAQPGGVRSTGEFLPITPEFAQQIAASNPALAQTGRFPSFINTHTGVVYDQNMQPIGSTNPAAQRPNTTARQESHRPPSNSGTRRPPIHDSYDDDDYDDGYYDQPRKKGGLLRSVGRGIAKTAGFGMDVGMSFREAKQAVDDKNQDRLARYEQSEANRAITRMERRSRRGGWL